MLTPDEALALEAAQKTLERIPHRAISQAIQLLTDRLFAVRSEAEKDLAEYVCRELRIWCMDAEEAKIRCQTKAKIRRLLAPILTVPHETNADPTSGE